MAKNATNIVVKPRRNEPQERMIRRFIKKVKKSGLIEEVKKRKYYIKPSQKRRLKAIKKKREIAKAKAKEKQNN
tara:strand:+ start:5429 stop:5650 length:222 start_codon:yes stop_codon:yes gene_type:complete